MKFTEFIADYVKKHPGIKYKDAIKDKKIRCLWHAHRGEQIGCPTKCPPQTPQVVPDMSQSRPYRMLPRPVEMQPASYTMPEIPTVPSAAREIPQRPRDPVRPVNASPSSLGNFGKREAPVQMQSAPNTFLSSLMPSNFLHALGETFAQINPADVSSDRVEVISETPHATPKRRGRPPTKRQAPLMIQDAPPAPSIEQVYKAPSGEIYGENPRITVRDRVADIERKEAEQRYYLKKGLQRARESQKRVASLRANSAQRRRDRILDQQRTAMLNERTAEQIRNNEPASLSREGRRHFLGFDPDDQDDPQFSDMPPAEEIVGRGVGDNEVIKYPEYKNRRWVVNRAREILGYYRPREDEIVRLNKENKEERAIIDDIRRMELHRRYILANEPDLPAEGNEMVNRTVYNRPRDAKFKNQFFDQLGLTEYWLSPDVQRNKHTHIFVNDKNGLLKQYREGSGKKGKREDILSDKRWLEGALTKEQREAKAIEHAQQFWMRHPMATKNPLHPSFTDPNDPLRQRENLTLEQRAVASLSDPNRTAARLAQGFLAQKEHPHFKRKETEKRYQQVFGNTTAEIERKEEAANKRRRTQEIREEELRSGQTDRRVITPEDPNPTFYGSLDDVNQSGLVNMTQRQSDLLIRNIAERAPNLLQQGVTVPQLDAQAEVGSVMRDLEESLGITEFATDEQIDKALRALGPTARDVERQKYIRAGQQIPSWL